MPFRHFPTPLLGRTALLLCLAVLEPRLAGAEGAVVDGDLRARVERLAATQPQLSPAVRHSLHYNLDVSERVDGRFAPQAQALRARVGQWLDRAEAGHDPLLEAKGEILMRGYRSKLADARQGYAVYLPEGYDPSKRYPLMVVLHGGSANGNLFLGVVLGNNMNWKEYNLHLWDAYTPRWKPDWIVVAPDGFGHVMWRFMGEQDVLDVIADVQENYSVDDDRVVLCGLSNGGVGAYNMGMRHAHRFAAVIAIAGAPSWVQYAGARETPLEQRLLHPLSGMQLAENAQNTDFRYYHGHTDGGPMKPRFVKALTEHIETLGVPYKETWFDAGHDLLYLVHRHGRIYSDLDGVRRQGRPSSVRLQTGDYRAARQHWLEATAIHGYPTVATARGEIKGNVVDLTVEGLDALSLHIDEMPLEPKQTLTIRVNGQQVHEGPVSAMGDRLHLRREGDRFLPGFLEPAGRKRPGMSGPITDAYFGPMLHVYGTGNPEHVAELKKQAERGSRGWPLWLWNFQQPIVADVEVTDALLQSHHLVLYGTPGDNALLERIADKLPIRIGSDHVMLGKRKLSGKDLGVKFIYPSPLAADRYVIVQAAPTLDGVAAGHKLPDFLPDYVVHDSSSTRTRPRLLYGRGNAPLEQGFFDDRWQLPFQGDGKGADDVPKENDPKEGTTPKPASGEESARLPAEPQAPRRFASHKGTQAGKAARVIARRLFGFENFRAQSPLGTWASDPVARWSIEDNQVCLKSLAEAGIRVLPHRQLLRTPVPTPVELTGRVGGVWFRSTHEERPLLLSCEFVRRLPVVSQVLRRHRIRGVDVMSTYREAPRASMHTMGLAVDLLRFFRLDGVLSVLDDFEETPDRETCRGPAPRRPRAKELRAIACSLASTQRFATVLTPNYNEGHRDHFHLDARPDDPRTLVR